MSPSFDALSVQIPVLLILLVLQTTSFMVWTAQVPGPTKTQQRVQKMAKTKPNPTQHRRAIDNTIVIYFSMPDGGMENSINKK